MVLSISSISYAKTESFYSLCQKEHNNRLLNPILPLDNPRVDAVPLLISGAAFILLPYLTQNKSFGKDIGTKYAVESIGGLLFSGGIICLVIPIDR